MAFEQSAAARGLVPLSGLDDYEVAEGYSDVRGFEVRDEDGSVVGEVDDLLVDPDAESVRSLVVALDDEVRRRLPLRAGRVEIPLGAVTVLEQDEAVRLRRPLTVVMGLIGPPEPEVAGPQDRAGGAGRADPCDRTGSEPERQHLAPGRPGLTIEPGPGGDVIHSTGELRIRRRGA